MESARFVLAAACLLLRVYRAHGWKVKPAADGTHAGRACRRRATHAHPAGDRKTVRISVQSSRQSSLRDPPCPTRKFLTCPLSQCLYCTSIVCPAISTQAFRMLVARRVAPPRLESSLQFGRGARLARSVSEPLGERQRMLQLAGPPRLNARLHAAKREHTVRHKTDRPRLGTA